MGGQNAAFLEMGLGAGTPSSLNENRADGSTSPRKDEGSEVLRSGKGDWMGQEGGSGSGVEGVTRSQIWGEEGQWA